MDEHSKTLLNEYINRKPLFETMKGIVLTQINSLLAENEMMVTAVEGRVKTQKSLEGKLELKGYKYHSLDDITDILGIRVIAFYTNQIDKIASIVEKSFDIDWENSVDKRRLLSEDQFGYMSIHYICSIPKALYFDAEHPELNSYKFEIQVRTALQHVWATAYHDTGYKSDIEVPREYIRAINRLAWLLEIADTEFSNVLRDITEYRRNVSALFKDGKFEDLQLNGDTFNSYIDIKPFKMINQRIAGINHAEIQERSFAPYFEVFKDLGFETIADIEKMKADCEEDAYRLAALQLGATDLDILSETVGVQNLCLVYIIKSGRGERGIRTFLDLLNDNTERNAKSAKRILAQAESLNITAIE